MPVQRVWMAEMGLSPEMVGWLSTFGFLIREKADIDALLRARARAEEWGVAYHVALFSGPTISEDHYGRAFADAYGFRFGNFDFSIDPDVASGLGRDATRGIETPVLGQWRGSAVTLVCVTDAHVAIVWDRIARARELSRPILLVTRRELYAAYERARSRSHIRMATHSLMRRLPHFSAWSGAAHWQVNAFAIVVGFISGGFIAYPPAALIMISMLLTVAFFGVTFVRLVAIAGVFRRPGSDERISSPVADADLPTYSILVALYDEVRVLPSLVDALAKLDYPAAKLDCMLIIEDVDTPTKAAFLDLALPSFMRVVIVPEGKPQTKPRALNYALRLARGDYVVIYDAEDRPEPDQLRRAYGAFSRGGPNVACVQSCLNIFNSRQSWITRQFTVEYSALFDCILPALQWIRVPMPLGGTSNHFPRVRLMEMHGWDPYNVTEDADLGIRIARLGYTTATIQSTTWEEAPATFRLWRNQRTRWIKGWMQTYLVHTRQPIAMMRDLGVLRTLGFHLYMGGLVLSAVVHPLFYASVAVDQAFGWRFEFLETDLGGALWQVAVCNLVLGYVSSIVVGIVSVRRRGHRLTLSALLMPLYWLLISLAAYRAIWQLYWDPFRWEKTPHGVDVEEDDG